MDSDPSVWVGAEVGVHSAVLEVVVVLVALEVLTKSEIISQETNQTNVFRSCDYDGK